MSTVCLVSVALRRERPTGATAGRALNGSYLFDKSGPGCVVDALGDSSPRRSGPLPEGGPSRALRARLAGSSERERKFRTLEPSVPFGTETACPQQWLNPGGEEQVLQQLDDRTWVFRFTADRSAETARLRRRSSVR